MAEHDHHDHDHDDHADRHGSGDVGAVPNGAATGRYSAEGDENIQPQTDETPALDPELLVRRQAALAHVLKFGDPVLKSKASPVAAFDEKLAKEIERMLAIMRDGMGVGLAATQLGILRRILVFQAGHDAEPAALINPEID